MKYTSLSLVSFLSAALQASAHGYVSEVTIDGKAYAGNTPGGTQNDSIIRQISDISPVQFSSSEPDPEYLNCGRSTEPAALVAEANPGSVVTFKWTNPVQGNWIHSAGPMLTYMASCGSTTCDKFNSTNAEWFKIAQLGRKTDDVLSWYQVDVHNGTPVKVTIPQTLASGNYLIRHEIITLHNAELLYGVEFYPSCTQLRILGTESGTPKSSDLVSFPGAYQSNEPGLYVHDPNIYTAPYNYTFPGPEVASLVSGSSTSTTSATAPSCETASSARNLSEHAKFKRQAVSRIMRDLFSKPRSH